MRRNVSLAPSLSVLFALGMLMPFATRLQAQEIEPPQVMVDAKVALSSLIALADTHIQDTLNSLEVLAGSSEVKSLDWEKMKGLLGDAQKRSVPCLMWFAKPDGSYYTTEKGLTDQTLTDRPYFPKLMAGEKVLGSLVVSKTTGKKSAVVAVPIKKGDEVVGALGASIFLEELSGLLAKELEAPPNIHFFALDADGQTVINRKSERIFIDPTAQGSPSLTAATEQMLEEQSGMVQYDVANQAARMMFQASPLTHWRFALGVVINKPASAQ